MDLNVSVFSLMPAFGRTAALVAAFVIVVTSQSFTNSAHTAEGGFTDTQKTELNKMIE